MVKRQHLPILLVALGLTGIAIIVAILGLTGTLGSDDPSPAKVQKPTTLPSPTSILTPTPSPSPSPTTTSAPTPMSETDDASTPDERVAPDPDFERELREARFSTRGWETDFSRHSVPYSEIISGGPPPDGIPPIDDPKFVSPEDADRWLTGQEPVIALEIDGDARAYPLQIMIWHEIVNDVVGDVPVTVTFCPLCNSAIVFDRRLDGVTYDFGTSGNLRNSDLIMWDRQTESWWQQLTGEAIVGELTGKVLTFLPAPIVSWEDFKAANTGSKVLSRSTGFPS